MSLQTTVVKVLVCHYTKVEHACKSESTLIDSRILGNFVSSSNTGYKTVHVHWIFWTENNQEQLFRSNLSRKVSIWLLEINLSLGGFRVVLLVGSDGDGIFSSSVECFVGMGFIDHFKFDFPPRTMYFSSKWSSHKTECFVGFQSLRLTNRIHSLFSSRLFKGKWNFVICFVSSKRKL